MLTLCLPYATIIFNNNYTKLNLLAGGEKGIIDMRLTDSHWLLNTPIAHRGLWDENTTENSILAFQKAIENGYPIEIDVHKSLDGQLFVFHDNNLLRLTGVDNSICNMTEKEVKSLRLNKSEQEIPTLKKVLECINGKVPILLEIKPQKDNTIVDRVVEDLKGYKGDIAIQSFNPLYIARLKKIASEYIRGILATEVKQIDWLRHFLLKHMFLNFIAKPDFISYSFTGLPIKRKQPVICWTITNQEDYDKIKGLARNIIFENFIPKK